MTEVAQLKEQLQPQLRVVGGNGNGKAPSLSVEQARKGLILPSRAKALLLARDPGDQDRSARLYELASLLVENGASPRAAFVLVQQSTWNKFRERDDEVERLWEAIDRAVDSTASKRPHLREQGLRKSGRHRPRSRAVSLSQLLARDTKPAEWCVDGIWQHRGYGFVAGEPKTYKSTFATDLGVSLASGTPFLGHFPVSHPGPVLVVQEENTEDIQSGRFRRIMRERNLGGKLHHVGKAGIVFEPPTSCPVYCLDRKGFSFATSGKRKGVEREIRALEPALVVFDPLQMMMGDLNIRKESDVAQVLNWLNELNELYRCGVLIVHHYHKRREDGPQLGGQRMLGSQILHAWLTCGLYVQRVHGSRMRVDREYRAFADHGPFELEFQSEDDEDFYKVNVHENLREENVHPLVDLVCEHPGITLASAAKKLGIDKSNVSRAAKRYGLQAKSTKIAPGGKKGGRPQVRLFLSEETRASNPRKKVKEDAGNR